MAARLRVVPLLCFLLGTGAVHADVFRPAYLELRQRDAESYDVLWKVPAQGEALRLGIQVRFPPDTRNVTTPRGVFSAGAYLERWTVQRVGGLAGQTIRIEGLPGSITDVLARLERVDGSSQVARLQPAQPSFIVEAAASTFDVARSYLVLGIEHILGGIDHLLFVLALLLIVRGWRRVIITITAFTIAHSITLATATLGFVRVPQPPVEAAIALSIVFVAAEIVHGLLGRPGLTARAPWIVALTFGLLHGFGFAGALAEVGLPQHAIPVALLFFNVGVEIGQLLFVGAVAVVALLLRSVRIAWPRWAELIPAYGIGVVAMFWVIQRIADFPTY
jgi:hydrogenase/urease accessory protein HupE